jgi:hypothetical protein
LCPEPVEGPVFGVLAVLFTGRFLLGFGCWVVAVGGEQG